MLLCLCEALVSLLAEKSYIQVSGNYVPLEEEKA